MKRFGSAATHEVGNQFLGAAQFFASSPYQIERGFNYVTGRQNYTFSTWNEKQSQFFNRAEDWMYRALPTDMTHPDYQMFRRGIGSGIELGSYLIGGYGLAKGGMKAAIMGANAWKLKKGTFVAGEKLALTPQISKKIANRTRAAQGIDLFHGELLNIHLSQMKKYGSQGYCQLQNNKIRYYGELKAPMKEGEMIGRRRVREWDPETRLKRTWHETLDSNNNIRIVRHENNNGIKIHYLFDSDGNYTNYQK